MIHLHAGQSSYRMTTRICSRDAPRCMAGQRTVQTSPKVLLFNSGGGWWNAEPVFCTILSRRQSPERESADAKRSSWRKRTMKESRIERGRFYSADAHVVERGRSCFG